MSGALFPGLIDPDDRQAVRFANQSLTYRELAGAAAAVGERVRGARRVAVWAEPGLELAIAVAGALSAGVAVVPINPGSGARELAHILEDSSPTLLLTAPGRELPEPLWRLPRLEVERSAGGGALPDELADADVAFVIYTSGTTGPPKGVQIPRRAITSNLDALAEIWKWTSNDQLVHALPMFHVHGLVIGLLGPLRRSGQLEHLGRFAPKPLMAAVKRGATMMFGVPTMYHRLAGDAAERAELARAIGRLRLLVSGSAALPASDHRRIRELTGQAILERYGLTETLMNAGTRVGDEVIPGRVGPPLPGVEVRLLDDRGATIEVSDDETIGEIAVRGPNLFAGYLNRPEATAAAVRDGWFVTGDLATRATSGSLRIVGRKATDLIKSGGYRIGAGEVEGALLEHPAVSEAAVAGAPDPDLGERVVAWVVLTPGRHADEQELIEHVTRALARHKRPRELHFLDALPRNEMGKVLKHGLARPG